MNPRRILIPFALALPIALSGCAASAAGTASLATPGASAPTQVTTDPSCPGAAELKDAPKRVVTMDAGAAAFIVELGFGDTIVGTAAPDFAEDFDGDLRAKLDAIPVLDSARGSAEAVVAAEPDLVVGISPYEFGKFDGTPSVQQLHDAGSAALSACGAMQDGPMDNIDERYRYIAALADVFDVPERGEKLISQLRTEVDASASNAASDEVPVLALSRVPDAGTGIATNGGSSFANAIITLAGGTNIARDQLQDFATLSAETVAAADPKVIVAISGFSADSDAELKAQIAATPLLAGTTAARSGNIVVIPQRTLMSPSMLNAEAVRMIADAVAKAS
ncbi:ABC transporter substrate-binding protein [Agreia sp. VKM Ac-1783]|uniref:ABC transporter substrate-binding protein n=1 Tax=Agreia sp. VKM Ac-1783 TaxID=1938889 RepID=UPI000A36101B|nr:ABC transporter substrate-binding protein [Agreia sp. VKM Ac-1783]